MPSRNDSKKTSASVADKRAKPAAAPKPTGITKNKANANKATSNKSVAKRDPAGLLAAVDVARSQPATTTPPSPKAPSTSPLTGLSEVKKRKRSLQDDSDASADVSKTALSNKRQRLEPAAVVSTQAEVDDTIPEGPAPELKDHGIDDLLSQWLDNPDELVIDVDESKDEPVLELFRTVEPEASAPSTKRKREDAVRRQSDTSEEDDGAVSGDRPKKLQKRNTVSSAEKSSGSGMKAPTPKSKKQAAPPTKKAAITKPSPPRVAKATNVALPPVLLKSISTPTYMTTGLQILYRTLSSQQIQAEHDEGRKQRGVSEETRGDKVIEELVKAIQAMESRAGNGLSAVDITPFKRAFIRHHMDDDESVRRNWAADQELASFLKVILADIRKHCYINKSREDYVSVEGSSFIDTHSRYTIKHTWKCASCKKMTSTMEEGIVFEVHPNVGETDPVDVHQKVQTTFLDKEEDIRKHCNKCNPCEKHDSPCSSKTCKQCTTLSKQAYKHKVENKPANLLVMVSRPLVEPRGQPPIAAPRVQLPITGMMVPKLALIGHTRTKAYKMLGYANRNGSGEERRYTSWWHGWNGGKMGWTHCTNSSILPATTDGKRMVGPKYSKGSGPISQVSELLVFRGDKV